MGCSNRVIQEDIALGERREIVRERSEEERKGRKEGGKKGGREKGEGG